MYNVAVTESEQTLFWRMETSTETSQHSLHISLNASTSLSMDQGLYNISQETNLTAHLQVDPPSWPIYLPIYITLLNALVFFTGIVGNVLVITVVILVPDMRTPMNWYLVNLSLADLLVLFVCQPAALTEFFARERWLLGAVLCKMVPFLEHAVLHTSTLIILAITVERYYAICRPLKKLVMCHKPRPWRVLSSLWSFAILTSVPFVFMTNLENTHFFDGTPCQVCATIIRKRWHYMYIISMAVCFFAVPMVLLLFLYTKIIQCLRTSGTSLRSRQEVDVATVSTHRSRKQIIKMLVGIVILFFVSLLPVRCVIIWQIFAPDAVIERLGPESYYNLIWICRLLMYTNSAGNPIIYSLISSKFQIATKRLLMGRRKDPIDRINRNSLSSQCSSFSRLSVTGTYRGCLSPTSGSRLRVLPACSLERSSVNSSSSANSKPTHRTMRRVRTTSLSSWSKSQGSPISSPLISEGNTSPFLKQKSCTSIL